MGEIAKTDFFENKKVVKGDTLIWLRTDELDEQISRLKEKQNENTFFMRDIDGLLKGLNNARTPKYKTESIQFAAKIKQQDISLAQTFHEYSVSKSLYDKDVEAEYDYRQYESKYKIAISQRNLLKQQQETTWQAKKTRLEYENKDLVSQINQLEKKKDQYILTAPITGNIVQFNGQQPGSFIAPGLHIAQISPIDSLLIECYVTPYDIGYIDIGRKVRFQVDAFNYQQWGLLEGKVVEIIQDVIQIDNTPFFRVRCTVDRNFLQLANGYRGEMKKGMTVIARFFLTKRSLSQLLFDKIDNWLNPKLIANGNKN